MKDRARKEFNHVGQLIQSQIADQIADPENSPAKEAVQVEIRRRWGRCAGRAAAASFPLLFRSGRLVIFTESAIWATELRHQQQAIRQELESFNIKEIEVKARPGILPTTIPKRRNVALSRRNGLHLHQTANRIEHRGLKDALKRLAQKANYSD